MANCRGKFQVKVVEYVSDRCEDVVLRPKYDPEDPLDRAFHEATPTGELHMRITNEELLGTFLPGELYYLDLTRVDNE